jgi:hypothetical protein
MNLPKFPFGFPFTRGAYLDLYRQMVRKPAILPR